MIAKKQGTKKAHRAGWFYSTLRDGRKRPRGYLIRDLLRMNGPKLVQVTAVEWLGSLDSKS